jgi:hypothetical protein
MTTVSGMPADGQLYLTDPIWANRDFAELRSSL